MTPFERVFAGVLLIVFGLGMAALVALVQLEGQITIRTRTFDRDVTPIPYWSLYLLCVAIASASLVAGALFFMGIL